MDTFASNDTIYSMTPQEYADFLEAIMLAGYVLFRQFRHVPQSLLLIRYLTEAGLVAVGMRLLLFTKMNSIFPQVI